MSQSYHPGLLAEAQDLNKQTLEGIEVAAPKLAVAAVVRLLVGGENPESQDLVAKALDLAGEDDADAAVVEQRDCQPHRGRHRLHPRGKPLLPKKILALGGNQKLQKIYLSHPPGPAGSTPEGHLRASH